MPPVNSDSVRGKPAFHPIGGIVLRTEPTTTTIKSLSRREEKEVELEGEDEFGE